jgi:hypothetical protein
MIQVVPTYQWSVPVLEEDTGSGLGAEKYHTLRAPCFDGTLKLS